ncbi:MucB/RseB C-terminal domain-containing protein [Castellaniella sp.]|uniref:MucB/RseB C-terminal domain-containing protein n=1 Tax=Castellaniella sp. TaxID=1955812 RepID=UPI002AFEEA16|nr:MucB/RseB C-terminal domain-containing protein [Castellaniella sp.]
MTSPGGVARWGVGLLLGLLLGGAYAADPKPSPQAAPDVLAFLQQVQDSARKLDYVGTYTYQEGHHLMAFHLTHMLDGMGERERLEVLDGPPRECLRQNGIEQCLHPGAKLIVSQPARSDHFPGLLLDNAQSIVNHYDWQPLPHHYRVAGRECAVSDLKARDDLRYSYRLCTDTQTHLLLKLQTLDTEGQVIDQTAFSNIQLGADAQPATLVPSWDTRSWRLVTESVAETNLQAQGWRFTLPAGFLPVIQLTRQIGRAHAVNQYVISDGLAAISIFIETFDPERDQNIRQGDSRQGTVNVYRMRLASYWLTAVGEVPARTVRDLVRAVQYVPQAAH